MIGSRLCTGLAVLVLLSSTACAQAEKVIRDIDYAGDGEKYHRLDLYLPKGVEQPPLVVWIHGGAWRRGSKAKTPLGWLVRDGYAVASVEYRLSPVAKFPAQAHDIKAGIRFLRAHAEKELGGAFDIRLFHDEILRHGAVPLEFLEALVKAWVDEQKQGR